MDVQLTPTHLTNNDQPIEEGVLVHTFPDHSMRSLHRCSESIFPISFAPWPHVANKHIRVRIWRWKLWSFLKVCFARTGTATCQSYGDVSLIAGYHTIVQSIPELCAMVYSDVVNRYCSVWISQQLFKHLHVVLTVTNPLTQSLHKNTWVCLCYFITHNFKVQNKLN